MAAMFESSLKTSMPRIRPACSDDFTAIGRIFHESVHQLANRDYSEAQLFAWSRERRTGEYWRARTAALEIRVAVLDDSLAGFIGFSHSGHIDLLYTLPTFARRGVARTLLLEAESELTKRAVTIAWTEASVTACSFFLSMGYQVVSHQIVSINGIELRNSRMEKILRSGRSAGGAV
jgi:putative acetyltransferase